MADSTDRIGWLLKRAQGALNAAMGEALAEHGLTLSQYAVLTALLEQPGLSNADLARRAFVTPQTMNQVLRELETRGLVARRPHAVHGRVLQAHLTPDGERSLRGCTAGVDAVEERMLAGLPAADRQRVADALRMFTEALTPSA
ncbi:MarR family transcriptional regulator [Modestobacter sp. NPDC049651]|uniref:MarR family winged helix-turn-helix transcriptional regulator n=1 Tax=unclassified Modestobacter TaxID=2643866 RepID=UPI0033C70521